jgi:hypothetical protein
MPKHKDFELIINVHMSRKLFLIITIITWIWTIFSFFYAMYVAQTGINPILDWSVGLPNMISSYFTGFSGVWGILFGGVIIWILCVTISAIVIYGFREK